MNNKTTSEETNPTDSNELEALDLIKNMSFCVFDLETTGGNHKSDKIIEIGLVKIENLKIVEKMDFLIQPQIKIPEFIQKLTSISPDDVKDSPLIENVIEEVLAFMGGSILVAHNTSFDVPFFNSVLRRLDKPELENKSLCTNLMTKYLIPNLLNSNLNYMSKIFNIHHQKAHRALDDAMATAELLINYLNIFIHKDIQKINHLYYPRNRYELDRIHYKEGSDNKKIHEKLVSLQTPSLVTLKGENGVILFSLPCSNTKEEIDFITKKLEETSWKTATIKLYGPFIEALIHFNTLFTKLEPTSRSEIMKFLWAKHLNQDKMPVRQEGEKAEGLLGKGFGDFLIAHHLVPEQMLIFPIASMHQKNQLIFRYPGHKKKLLQYISSKAHRINSNKLKNVHYHPALKDFIDQYLIRTKESETDLFIFKKGLPMSRPDEFIKTLDDFLAKNENSYNYPSEYI